MRWNNVAVLLGKPLGQSLSVRLQNNVYAAVAINMDGLSSQETEREDLRPVPEGLRQMNFADCGVTKPYWRALFLHRGRWGRPDDLCRPGPPRAKKIYVTDLHPRCPKGCASSLAKHLVLCLRQWSSPLGKGSLLSVNPEHQRRRYGALHRPISRAGGLLSARSALL